MAEHAGNETVMHFMAGMFLMSAEQLDGFWIDWRGSMRDGWNLLNDEEQRWLIDLRGDCNPDLAAWLRCPEVGAGLGWINGTED